MKKQLNLILTGIIVLAFAAAAYTLIQRVTVENADKTLEIALDFTQVEQLARDEGSDTTEVYRSLKEAGATAVLYKEQSYNDLHQVSLLAGNDPLLWAFAQQLDFPVDYEGSYFVINQDSGLAGRIFRQLTIKGFAPEKVARGGMEIIHTAVERSKVANLGLGFPEEEIKAAADQGLDFMPQVKYWPAAGADSIDDVFQPLADYPRLAAVLFNDHQLPGYPEKIDTLAADLREMGVPLVTIEFFEQEGLKSLAYSLNKRMVRLHAVGAEEVKQYDTPALMDRFMLAARERNAGILLLRFKADDRGRLSLTEAKDTLSQLHGELQAAGFNFGKARPFGKLPASRWRLLFIGLGTIAAGMLLLRRVGWPKAALLLGILAALGWAGALGTGMVIPGRKLMALATAVVFPTLAVTLANREGLKTFMGALTEFFKITAVSLTGGIFVSAILSDLGFMLKLDQFVGVKAAHVIPLLLLAAIFFFLIDHREWREKLLGFLKSPITVVMLAVAAILAAAAFIYVSRTGNESAAVSGTELLMRDYLSKVLGVRPRTKEFLIGHPLMIFSLYRGYKNSLLPLWLFGAIGQVSLVNTFAHIHTPFLISLARTFNGIWLGVIGGLVLIALWRLLEKYGSRWLN